ncbi:hypothetical protein ACFWYW_28780 [Nonomuraea sp. NPDC059023]|uniref:hypothetical protein n=1 Tax=unclassified Nonomuraea TaxID=2593643 RepID=UPI003688A459
MFRGTRRLIAYLASIPAATRSTVRSAKELDRNLDAERDAHQDGDANDEQGVTADLEKSSSAPGPADTPGLSGLAPDPEGLKQYLATQI